ncbi:hypothetical protein ACFQ1I_46245 [Kitasatospora arboriphila]
MDCLDARHEQRPVLQRAYRRRRTVMPDLPPLLDGLGQQVEGGHQDQHPPVRRDSRRLAARE